MKAICLLAPTPPSPGDRPQSLLLWSLSLWADGAGQPQGPFLLQATGRRGTRAGPRTALPYPGLGGLTEKEHFLWVKFEKEAGAEECRLKEGPFPQAILTPGPSHA